MGLIMFSTYWGVMLKDLSETMQQIIQKRPIIGSIKFDNISIMS